MSPRSDATELVHPRNKPEADVHGKFSPIVIQRTNPLVEKHARMTHEEATRRLSLTQPSGYSNFFSSGNEGKATRDDLHGKDWDGSSLRAGPAAAPPHLSPSWRWVTVGRGKWDTVEC